ncbi:MAG TPA: VapC toxin family PIN domain ribonuclease [Solibacterales bacterium]|nr:VapC toxin family PIN domain ribonuclease [Bryobacterales bacterium]
MPGVVVDTHTIVWYLQDDRRLSARAADVLDAATAAGEVIYVPSICLVELTYLIEKHRLPALVRDQLLQTLDDPASPCSLAPLDRAVADALHVLKRSEVPDMPDRIVAATAVALGLPLISRDARVRAAQVTTIW